MRFLRNIKVRVKLTLSFIIVAVLIGVIGIVEITSLRTINTNSQSMYNNELLGVYMLTDMNKNLIQSRNDIVELIYVKDESRKSYLKNDIQINVNKNEKYIVAYEKIPINNIQKQVWETYRSQLKTYRVLRENIIKLVDEGDFQQANKQYQSLVISGDLMMSNLNKLIDENLNQAKAFNLDTNSIYARSNKIMIVLVIIGLLLAVALGSVMSIHINKPLIKIRSYFY